MNPARTSQAFHIAPFAMDGELLGRGIWKFSDLSTSWLELCRGVLERASTVFNGPLPPPFDRVALRFTSAKGVGLATFSVAGIPAAASAFLRGENATAETELLTMFVESARAVEAVQRSQRSAKPFAEVFTLSERPLHIVIAWGTAPAADTKAIADLGNHLAGAFFC
jgi:hypothetical protein